MSKLNSRYLRDQVDISVYDRVNDEMELALVSPVSDFQDDMFQRVWSQGCGEVVSNILAAVQTKSIIDKQDP